MALLSRFALLSAIPILLGGSASSQSLPKAPKTEVITVTPKPGFFTEPSIAVNPANPQQVVAAFRTTLISPIPSTGDPIGSSPRESSRRTIAFPEMFQSLSIMKDAPTFVTSPSISSVRLIIGDTTHRAMASTFAAHWMEARPGRLTISPRPSRQIKLRFRGKTNLTSSRIWDADLMPATFI
jgi:hypothetical protein